MAKRIYTLSDGRQVHWDSDLCTPDEIVAQVQECPSGALYDA